MTKSPYLYDRWDDEVALEKEMLALGSDRVRDRINKARERRDMNRLRPYRSLLKEWVIPCGDAIKAWISRAAEKRGPRPIALPLIKDMDPDVLSIVALKTMLRLLGVERRNIMGMASEVGTWVEHEARASVWEEELPEEWRSLQAHYARRGSDAVHQRRSKVAIFNKHVSDKIGWHDWSDEERIRVGLALMDIVITCTKRFRIAGDPQWRPKPGKISRRPLVVEADPELLDWLSKSMDDEMVHAPVFMPTLIPPKPWIGPRDGGYWTPFVKTPFLIRFKANHEEVRQIAIEEYEALDMPDVYEAVNTVQNTPWSINRRVYEVAQQVWDKDLAIGGMPRREAEFVPGRPPEADEDEEVRRKWAREAAEVRTRNATRVSQFIAYKRVLGVAARFLEEPAFYFPHMLDFRGRTYPITTDLSPQGGDLHRGLLTFSTPKPVGSEDAGWLAIHLANCFGVDKVSFEDRIEWVEERNDTWRAISEDPLGNRLWADQDDAWQCLAAVFEWVRYLDEGEGMLSALPVRVDGTCNGIQHLSAMLRDEVAGASVNLIPGDSPNDIYQDVADELTRTLEANLDENSTMWLSVFEGRAPRSVTKRPVMILPYGGTRQAYFTYTMEWLLKNDPEGIHIPRDKRGSAVQYLTALLWDAVSKAVVSGRLVMDWLKACSAETSKTGLPIYWKTPAGFVVRHFYAQMEGYQIKTLIDGQKLQLQGWREKKDLDSRSQVKGIAPNFVHSMDASALMTTVLYAAASGVTSLTTIHDAFGTVAADMHLLTACLREAFIKTHSEPVLEQFLRACKDVAGEDRDWPPIPERGALELDLIRGSEYFFA